MGKSTQIYFYYFYVKLSNVTFTNINIQVCAVPYFFNLSVANRSQGQFLGSLRKLWANGEGFWFTSASKVDFCIMLSTW